jgi:preprotein translocase subunit SecG
VNALIVLLYVVHVLVSLFLVLVVLLQQGKGADLSVFGGGSTQAAFGARGAATLLHKLTVVGFILFTLTTLSIAIMQGYGDRGTVMGSVPGAEPAPASTPPAEPPAGSPDAGGSPPPAEAGSTAPAAAGSEGGDAPAPPPAPVEEPPAGGSPESP